MELAATFLRWMGPELTDRVDTGAAALDQISQASKTLILKAARAVNSKRALDASALFDDMAAAWERGIGEATKVVSA